MDEKKAKELKLCDNNIQIELNVESIFDIKYNFHRTKQKRKWVKDN